MAHRPLLLALAVTFAACSPTPPRQAPGPSGGFAGAGNIPERIVAPNVPVIEGLPQAVRVGLTVYVSGMVPVDSAGRLVGEGDVTAQARQALANLVAVVRAARGVPGDVVKVTLYLRGLAPAEVAAIRNVVLDGLDKAAPPAVTVVGVSALPEPAMQVMLDATAQLRSEFPDRTRMGSSDRMGDGSRGRRGGER